MIRSALPIYRKHTIDLYKITKLKENGRTKVIPINRKPELLQNIQLKFC